MSYKKFVNIIVGLFTCMFITNLAIFYLYGSKFMIVDGHGDLGRLGYIYIAEAATNQNSIHQLPRHMEMTEYVSNNIGRQMDIITIGDSFFNGGGGCYFQDILAENNDLSILNISPMPGYEAFDMALLMLYNGYFDNIIKPKYLILESVERSVAYRYGNDIDFNKYRGNNIPIEEINKYYGQKEVKLPISKYGKIDPRILEINIKYIKSKFNFSRNEGKLNELVYYENLNKQLFSNPSSENLLLYYHDDVKYYSTNEKVKVVNDNFNKLAKLCREKGIELIFMPAVNKYDLYYDYIEKPRYSRNMFFESMSELPKDYKYIDTKRILTEEINNGEVDIYWADDTHWSWKGEIAIVKELVKILEKK